MEHKCAPAFSQFKQRPGKLLGKTSTKSGIWTSVCWDYIALKKQRSFEELELTEKCQEKEVKRADDQARRADLAEDRAQKAKEQAAVDRERTRNAEKERKEERERASLAERNAAEANQQASKEKERASIAQHEREQERERAKSAEQKAAEANQLASKEKERASIAQRECEQEQQRAKSAEKKASEANQLASKEKERASIAQREREQEQERAKSAEKKAAEANQLASKEKERASISQRECEQEQERAKSAEKKAAEANQLASKEKERASTAQREREQERERAKSAEKKAAEANQLASKEKERASIAQREREQERERAKSAEMKAAEASQQATEIKQKAEQKEMQEKQLKEQFKWGPRTTPKWSEEESLRLRNKFQKDPNTTKGYTFLLFGPTSHGKSSIGNGFMAALEDHEIPPTYHHVAQSSESVSRGFKTKKYKLHRIIDMPGIFEGKAIKNEDIRKIVTGQVPWVSKITTTLETLDDPKSHNDTVECIIIILRYDMTELPPELKRQIGVIWSLCGEGVLSCHLVLTHLDLCDPQFKDTANLPNIYNSAKVLKAVENMSKATGIPPFNISFVKNYTTETETDVNSHLQYLRILNVVKISADQVIEARLTQASMAEDYRKQEEDNRKQEEDNRKQEEDNRKQEEDNRKQQANKVVTYNVFLFFLAPVLIAILIAYFSLF